MTTAAAQRQPRMTVGEFLAWSEDLPDEVRYELVAGEPLRLMVPTNIRHAQIQYNASDAMRAAIRTTGGSCEVFDAGRASPLVRTGTNVGSRTWW
jgi:Uma2 family endonuclease